MSGNEIYKDKYKTKAENIIQNNAHIPCLEGFYYFILSMEPTSVYHYLNVALSFIKGIDKEVQNINLDDYTRYLSSIRDKTSSYQITVYSALKKLSAYLVASGRLEKDYMQFIDRPKAIEGIKTKTKREKAFLTQEEVADYLINIEYGCGSTRAMARQAQWRERDMAIVMIFLNTGMRCAALYKLDIKDIDLEQKILSTTEKGGKIRKHTLNNKTIQAIQDWIDKRQCLLNDQNEDALFISNQRRRLSQGAISDIVKKYGDFKDKSLSPHKLRATYGTQLYEATGDLYFVQQCMNHNNPKTTEIYIRGKSDTAHQRASSIMEEFLKN